MALYRIEVPVHATAYIRATNKASALEEAAKLAGSAVFVTSLPEGDVEISDLHYDDPALPNVSLSPAMTIGEVPFVDATLIEEVA